MGISEQLPMTKEDWVLDLNRHSILLALSEAEMASAHIDHVDMGQLPILLATLDANEDIPANALQECRILVLEIRPDLPGSLERFAAIRASRPRLPVIAAIRDPNLQLVRALLQQGVRDVIGLPLSHGELASILQQVATELAEAESQEAQQGQLVTVLKSIGGVGATTVATHLAGALADYGGRGACLIDLDLQFGTAASYLGQSNRLSISDLLNAGARIDGQFVRSVASRTSTGLNVIAAPPEILPLEMVNADQVLRIIEIARQEYDHVVVDLPMNWTNWSLSLIARATASLLVVELSVASLRQAKRQLQLLGAQNIDRSNIRVIVNRMEKKLFRTIDLDDATQAIGHPVSAAIHNDYPLVRAAHDRGVLIDEIKAKSKILSDIANLVPLISPQGGI